MTVIEISGSKTSRHNHKEGGLKKVGKDGRKEAKERGRWRIMSMRCVGVRSMVVRSMAVRSMVVRTVRMVRVMRMVMHGG